MPATLLVLSALLRFARNKVQLNRVHLQNVNEIMVGPAEAIAFGTCALIFALLPFTQTETTIRWKQSVKAACYDVFLRVPT